MLGGYKWGVAVLAGSFGLALLGSAYGWGLPDDSQAQAQGEGMATGTSSRSGGYYRRSIGRASVRGFGGSGSSGGGYRSGK